MRKIAAFLALTACAGCSPAADPPAGMSPSDPSSILSASSPAPGSSTRGGVSELRLRFDLPARLDELLVDGPTGTIASMIHSLGEQRDYSVPVDAAAPGTYVVRWRARVAGSDHRGQFSFVVTE